MQVKKILITSDDGYYAPGVRVLAEVLKDKYELKIAATDKQQSGVGAMIHMREGGKWETTVVDGVETLYVDGSPVDALECAQSYFSQSFDLVIAGINWGENIGGATLASGTVSAAAWAVNIGLAPKAMAISWQVDPKLWTQVHVKDNPLAREIVQYPGETAARFVQVAIENNFWGAPMLNVNMPHQKSIKIRFAAPVPDLTQVYWYPNEMNRKTKRFSYVPKYAEKQIKDLGYDYPATKSGFITVTPCQVSFLDKTSWHKIKQKVISLG